MQAVPDEVKKCVVFSIIKTSVIMSGSQGLASLSAFLLLRNKFRPVYLYVLTARPRYQRHQSNTADSKVYIRMNTTNRSDWCSSEQSGSIA